MGRQMRVPRIGWRNWRSTVMPADRKVMLIALISITLIISAVSLVIVAHERAVTGASVARAPRCVSITLEQQPPEAPDFCPALPCTARLCP